MKFKLSIITINYNNLEGLKRTLKSVINQSWKEFEYIIIDGGSTDGSRNYIENNKKHLHYWVSEPDKGVYDAMNKGIHKATGEYLLFLNSGDNLSELDVLNKNHNYIKIFDLIYFNLKTRDLKKRENIIIYPEKLSFKFFIFGSIGHPSTLIKRDLFLKYGYYDDNLKIVSDWKFFLLSVVKHKVTYKKVNSVISTFYLDGVSSNNTKQIQIERQLVFEKYFTEFSYSDYLRLNDLEGLISSLKKSKVIKLLNFLGILKTIEKY